MLKDQVKALAKGANFAALTTLMPDGRSQTHPMWIDCDDEYLLLNTEVHRQKFKNIKRDPKATVMIWENTLPYKYAEVRGEVVETVTGPEARDHIDQLSKKMTGGPYQMQIQSERVILKVRPVRQIAQG
jgi:PPOX class probable F420-dependent enzyme